MEQSYTDPTVEQEELDQVEEPSEETQPEPQLVRIRYAGSTYEVPEHLADAWEKREADFQKKLSEQGSELGRLRQQSQPQRQQAQEQTQDSPNEDLEFFQSPTKAIKKHAQALRDEIAQEIRQEQAIERSRAAYWNKFYVDNPSLKDHQDLVDVVVQAKFQVLKDLTPEDSQRELATMLNGMLGKPSEPKKALNTRQVTSERPSNAPAPRQAPAPSGKPLTLSAALAAQAEKRRRAQYNISKEDDK